MLTTTKPTILVVEDHFEMRETLVNILQLEDFETLAAANSDEARLLLRKHSPDLAILDMQLPGKASGIDIMMAIRNTPRLASTLVILHTAEPAVDRLPNADAADLILLKPTDHNHLIALVHRLLQQPAGAGI